MHWTCGQIWTAAPNYAPSVAMFIIPHVLCVWPEYLRNILYEPRNFKAGHILLKTTIKIKQFHIMYCSSNPEFICKILPKYLSWKLWCAVNHQKLPPYLVGFEQFWLSIHSTIISTVERKNTFILDTFILHTFASKKSKTKDHHQEVPFSLVHEYIYISQHTSKHCKNSKQTNTTMFTEHEPSDFGYKFSVS